jgi:hypothetical protein
MKRLESQEREEEEARTFGQFQLKIFFHSSHAENASPEFVVDRAMCPNTRIAEAASFRPAMRRTRANSARDVAGLLELGDFGYQNGQVREKGLECKGTVASTTCTSDERRWDKT